ncbi:hypothetical protein G6L37_11955 [Agrobacterium rubi]|uniref:VapE domain-containing protein n=1 Tax=Agrobacterium rubi TaxID=28099 RepID=UPI0015728EA9|nr:VapE domain-containing protein [Agrobacterium rubi]NTF06876.1 hypothetical protein [Agrobacterium rubi]NTF19118.1 hypothetical protein [Agrobacterium rubi]NTF26081.1 hypothetical protein [Agrobacterium rubi]
MTDKKEFNLLGSNVVSISNAMKNVHTATTANASKDLIASFDEAAANGTFWYGDWLLAEGVTNNPEHKEIRGHLRKIYGFKTGQVDKHVAFITDFGSLPETVEERVEVMLRNCKASVSFNGIVSATVKGRSVDRIESLSAHLHLINTNYQLMIPTADIDRAVELWSANAKANLIKQTATRNKFDASIDATEAWNYVANQHTTYSAEFTIAVYKKFIWQVKKKMLELPVTYHLMPIILGPQGTGKSWFVREILCGPMQPFIHNSSFASLTEERMVDQWSFPIQFTDEMAYASLADMDAVKNRITCEEITYRPMRSNRSATTRNWSTFIGASNKDTLANMIRDETGNRRFAPVYFSSVQGGQRDAITFDPIVLWQSVNENGPDPMEAVKDELATIQKEQRHLSFIEQWLNEYSEEATTERYQFSTLWVTYEAWKLASNVKCKAIKNDFFASLRTIAAANADRFTYSKPKNRDCLAFLKANADSPQERVRSILDKAGVA